MLQNYCLRQGFICQNKNNMVHGYMQTFSLLLNYFDYSNHKINDNVYYFLSYMYNACCILHVVTA